MTPTQAQDFLRTAARYFRNRDTRGEDMAHWSNVYNADNCEKIATLISSLTPTSPSQEHATPSTPPAEPLNPRLSASTEDTQ